MISKPRSLQILTICILASAIPLIGWRANSTELIGPDKNLGNIQSSQKVSPDNRRNPVKGLVRLSKKDHAWFDLKRKIVVVDAEICQRKGILEMFACPLGTKDHESVLGIRAKASTVHACLLAVGAIPGQPASWDPEYKPATGAEIDVFVLWTDTHGKRHKVRGQKLVRHTRTQTELNHPWVFAGSLFWRDEEDREHYAADGGEFICVSNFARATLDIPVESSQDNADLLYEPFTERIPPRGTKVRLVLQPKQQEKNTSEKQP